MSKLSYFGAIFQRCKCNSYDKTPVLAATRYYFVEGHSLNDRPRLARVVSEMLSNLIVDDAPPESEVLDFLNGNEGRPEIVQALQALKQLGIHSIPKFIIQGQTVVDGAARPEVFIEVFREIESRGEVHNGPVFGDILGVPGEVIARGSHTPDVMAA